MNTLLLSLISQYRNIIAKDGEVEDYELRDWLKLDPELPERYKEPDKLDKLVVKILESPKLSIEERYIQRAELYNLGMTDAQIADKQNVTKGTIRFWRIANNLEENLSQEEDEKLKEIKARNIEIQKLYELGYGDYKIAQELKVSQSTVCLFRKNNGLPANYGIAEKAKKGGANATRKDTNDKVNF